MKFLNLILIIIFTAVSSAQGLSYPPADDGCLRPNATANAPEAISMRSLDTGDIAYVEASAAMAPKTAFSIGIKHIKMPNIK
jgi:hypothetical protein